MGCFHSLITFKPQNDYEKYWTEAFMLFDKKGQKQINNVHLGRVLRSLGMNPTHKQIQAYVKEMDERSSGSIQLRQFLKWMVCHQKAEPESKNDIFNAFALLDSMNTGTITVKSLMEILTREGTGEPLSHSEVLAVLKQVGVKQKDLLKDGLVNYTILAKELQK